MLRKALRGLGIALILMPEPFTTPIGLLLLGIVYLLRNRTASRRYLRGLIKFYLNQTRPHSQPAKIVHHSLKERLAAFDMARPRPPMREIAHHVIDDERLQRRYGARLNGRGSKPVLHTPIGQEATKPTVHHSLSSRWASYEWPRETVTSGDLIQPRAEKNFPRPHLCREVTLPQKGGPPQTADKVIFHNLRSNLSGYVLPSVPLTPEKAIEHTIDMVKLQRYYGRVLEERESERLAAEGKPPKPERIILRRYKETRAQPHAAEHLRISTLRAQPAFS